MEFLANFNPSTPLGNLGSILDRFLDDVVTNTVSIHPVVDLVIVHDPGGGFASSVELVLVRRHCPDDLVILEVASLGVVGVIHYDEA